MGETVKKYPSPEQMRLIFKDTYSFYLKWKDVQNGNDWFMVVDESHEIRDKYPFEICEDMLIKIMQVMEHDYAIRTKGE